MKFLKKMKNGGGQSTVTGYWLFEIKWLCSIVLLHFDGPSRDCYHQHAFDCVNWLISGTLEETRIRLSPMADWTKPQPSWYFECMKLIPTYYLPSRRSFLIRREDFHKVNSDGISWVLSFRGPWKSTWREFDEIHGLRTLTHGRKIVK